MRNTPDGVCPECGWEVEIGVLAANHDQRSALWAICAWSALIGAVPIVDGGWLWIDLAWPVSERNAVVILFLTLVLSLFAYGAMGIVALLWTRNRAFRGAHRWLAIGWVMYTLLAVFQIAPVIWRWL